MISAIWHFALAVACFAGAALVYFREERVQKNVFTDSLFLFFILFTLYHLSVSIPYLLFPENEALWAAGYILAVFIVFAILSPMYEVLVLRTLGFTAKKTSLVKKILLAVGLAAGLILIFDFQLPSVHHSGFILWNASLIAGSITFAAVMFVVVLWIYIYLANRPSGMTLAEKTKAAIFNFGSFMFLTASVYFVSRDNVVLVEIAFFTVTLGTLLYIFDLFIPRASKELPETNQRY